MLTAHWCYKVIQNTRKQLQYIRSISPNHTYHYIQIRLSPEDNKKLGGNGLHYMFINPSSKVIVFPESKYGNHRKYYLTKMQFKPTYGPNYLRLTYDGNQCTRKALFKDIKMGRAYNNQITEIPSIAYLTLKNDWSVTIIIQD